MIDVKAHRLKKQSASRVLELAWDGQYLTSLSGDNKVDIWKLSTKDGDWAEAIVKKIARTEKRKGLKRRRAQVGDDEEEASEDHEKV